MSKVPETVRAALRYADLGYGIFPCAPGGKRPLTENGLHAATADERSLTAWWQRWPDANLALLPPEDVLVLDFDERGVAEAWAARYAELRGAPRTRTPRGGAHYWLRVTRPERLKTRIKAADGAVDLRGLARAYLLVPSSQTVNGTYRWERDLSPPAALPETSKDLLKAVAPPSPERPDIDVAFPSELGDRARRYVLGALQSEYRTVAATLAGARNDRLNRAAYALGGYVALGLLSQEEVRTELMAAALICGLPSTEAARTIRSGLKAGTQAPRTLPATVGNVAS